MGGDAGNGAHAHHARLQAVDGRRSLGHSALGVQHLLHQGKQLLALQRKAAARARAVDKLQAELRFQPGHHLTECRLGVAQILRRLRELPPLHNALERLVLSCVHR